VRRVDRALALAVMALLAGVAPSTAPSVEVLPLGSAGAFVDAIGVNVHFHYTDTAYGNEQYPIVRDRLLGLGVHHLRDGLIDTRWKPYYAHIEELAQHGVRFDLVTAIDASPELIRTYPSFVPRAIEAYEGPNESDLHASAGWPETLVAAQRRLYLTVHQDPALSDITVIGPSFTSEAAARAIGDLAPFTDQGNIHIYFAGRNPGTAGWGSTGPLGTYGSLGYNSALAALVAPQKPLVVTESGYANDPHDPGAVPPTIAARYLVRVLLDNWNAGIRRTYLYELVDFAGDSHFGLLTTTGEPKPAYVAIRNLISVVDEAGIAVPPGNLHCDLRSGPDTRATLLAGSAGRFVLAAWRESPGWSALNHEPLTVAPIAGTLRCDRGLAEISARTFADDGTLSAPTAIAPARSVAFAISDRVVLLSFRANAGSDGL